MAEQDKTKAPEARAEGPRKSVQVCTGSKVVGEGAERHYVPTLAEVSNESDLQREGVLLKDSKPIISKIDGAKVYVTADGKKLRFRNGALIGLLLAFLLSAFSFQPSALAQYGVARTGLKIAATQAPYVTLSGVSATYGPATLLKVNYTAGKLYLGDTPVSVAAGQLTLTLSKTDCTGPAYSDCNIVYANSSGTVTFTAAIGTAAASGNSILAYVQTSATAVTEIRYPWETTLGDPAVSTASTIFASATNCSDSAGDAACAAAPAGSVVVDASDTATVVSTTAVTADSQIFLQTDASLGTRLSVTCNTQANSTFNPRVTARTAGTSFTITVDAGPTTNPLCLSFLVVN